MDNGIKALGKKSHQKTALFDAALDKGKLFIVLQYIQSRLLESRIVIVIQVINARDLMTLVQQHFRSC